MSTALSMAARSAAFDWSATPLGSPEGWSQPLKTLVGVMMASGQPMFLAWGPARTLIYNDSYAPMLADRHPHALGRPFLEVWGEVREPLEPLFESVFSGRAVYMDDIALELDRPGLPREAHFAFSYTPVRDEDGTVAGLFCACVETTNQVLADRRLKREREGFSRLFEQAPTFMAMLRGPEHRFELTNPAYLELVGRSSLVGQTLAEGLPEAVEQGFSAILDEVFASGEAYTALGARYDAQSQIAGGVTERYVDFVFQPMTDSEGQVEGIFVEGADVTERTKAERDLRHLNASLEERVQAEVAARGRVEEALRQSQKMEAVGQLTGGLAHDFNNLLTGITGSLELLKQRIADGRLEAAGRYIQAAEAAAKRAAALTHRLLAFSRRQTLDPKPTGVNRLISDMEELIRRTVGPHIELEVVGAGGLWPTLIDAPQLENALLNLCINARDAMPDGGRITIETANKWLDDQAASERDLPAGQYVSVCVTDTGAGMTPEVVERAFEPFFTTKPLGMGTGLGLSMTYGFVRQSGGQVRIYSELGQGTTLCLYLPRHLGEAKEAVDAPVASRPPMAQAGETGASTASLASPRCLGR